MTFTHFFAHHHYWLISYLLFMGGLAGFVDAIAGGGGLISIPALMMTGLPMATILGTNKLQAVAGTSMAVYKYYRNGFINFATVFRGLLMGFVGAACGAIAVHYFSNQFMQILVPFLLLGVFFFNLYNKNLGVHPGIKRLKEALFFPLFGFILGFYDGFFGPGVGNFWMISIVFFLGYTFLEASGYAKVLNLKSNIFSLAVFLYYGNIDYTLGGIMALGQLLGGYCGAHAVILKGSKLVRPFFLTIVFLNVITTFYAMIPHH